MGLFDVADVSSTGPSLGVYTLTAPQGDEWKPMLAAIKDLMINTVGATPWLPKGWLDAVKAIYADHPELRVQPAPALLSSGSIAPGSPAFADTDEKRQVWQELFTRVNAAVSSFANGIREAGLEEIAALQADAAFKDKLYLIVKGVADAPKTIIGAAGDFASDLLGTAIAKFLPVIIVGGVVAVLYFNREAIGKALGGRVVKAIG